MVCLRLLFFLFINYFVKLSLLPFTIIIQWKELMYRSCLATSITFGSIKTHTNYYTYIQGEAIKCHQFVSKTTYVFSANHIVTFCLPGIHKKADNHWVFDILLQIKLYYCVSFALSLYKHKYLCNTHFFAMCNSWLLSIVTWLITIII